MGDEAMREAVSFLAGVADAPASAYEAVDETLAALRVPAPEYGEPFDQVLRTADDLHGFTRTR